MGITLVPALALAALECSYIWVAVACAFANQAGVPAKGDGLDEGFSF
jgi:hypothetical protein